MSRVERAEAREERAAKQAAAKEAGVDVTVLENADDIDIVMKD